MKNFTNSDTALIGCGYWGTNIARVLTKIKKNKIIICDQNHSNTRVLKERFPNKLVILNNFKKILFNKKIQNVILATPPDKNLHLLKLCIKNKKNIFIEKPGLKKYSELINIKKIKNKKILMFGYIYLFNNNIKFIKKYISTKKNGKILYIKFQRQNLGPVRNNISASYDLSSHDLSIFLYLFNALPKLIKNSSHSILKKNIADISNLSFKFKNFFIDINNSWLNPDKIRRITIITNKKCYYLMKWKVAIKLKYLTNMLDIQKYLTLTINSLIKKQKFILVKTFHQKLSRTIV